MLDDMQKFERDRKSSKNRKTAETKCYAIQYEACIIASSFLQKPKLRNYWKC